MAVALPLEVYEVLERSFGKEDATKVVKSFETTISEITDYRWKTTKDELLDAIRKEFITKDVFVVEMKVFEERINVVRIELEAKIKSLDTKMNFLIILMFLALTIMNPVVADIIKGLIK
ncbi:MAG: hypothetical protein AB1297_07800 [bacterium]